MTRTRRGFTIWELLVLVLILLFLLLLLLPAVNVSRTPGRRSVCYNNLRQLALAIYQYEQSHREYPGYVMPQAVVVTPDGEVATRPISWVFALMSRLERSDIQDNYGPAAPESEQSGPFVRPDQRLSILVCPSDPSVEGKSVAPLSYVVNTGLKDPEPEVVMPADVPPDWPGNGVFHFHYPYHWRNDFDVPRRNAGDAPSGEKTTVVSSEFIQNQDGMSTTLLISENVDAGQWTDVREHQVGFYWQATADGQAPRSGNVAADDWLDRPLFRINEQTGALTSEMPLSEQHRFSRPAGFHPGGVVVAYADAHASFIASEIDYAVFCQLMTPAGAASGPAGPKGLRNGQRVLFKDLPDGRNNFNRPVSEEEL